MATQQAAAPVAAAAQSASVYWRAAGMTFTGYAARCAVALRKCMKEPFKTQTLSRENVHYKVSLYADGQQQKAGELISAAFVNTCVLSIGFLDLWKSKLSDHERVRCVLMKRNYKTCRVSVSMNAVGFLDLWTSKLSDHE